MTALDVSNEIMPIKSRGQMIRFQDGYSADGGPVFQWDKFKPESKKLDGEVMPFLFDE
jgi:hypothetical protein